MTRHNTVPHLIFGSPWGVSGTYIDVPAVSDGLIRELLCPSVASAHSAVDLAAAQEIRLIANSLSADAFPSLVSLEGASDAAFTTNLALLGTLAADAVGLHDTGWLTFAGLSAAHGNPTYLRWIYYKLIIGNTNDTKLNLLQAYVR